MIPQDVRDGAALAQAIDETAERYGRLDILINNAGSGSWERTAIEALADTPTTKYHSR